jgi:hypothetical protein
MKGKWRYICGIQTQLLFICLWFIQPIFAKSTVTETTKKEKVSELTKTQGRTPSVKKTAGATTLAQTPNKKGTKQPQAASSRPSARLTVTLPTGKGKKRTANNKANKRSVSRTTKKNTTPSPSATVTRQTKKGKKTVAAKPSSKTSRLAKSRGATQPGHSAVKQPKMQRTSVSASRKVLVNSTTESATRRELLTRNYDGAEMATRYSPGISPFSIQVNDEQFIHRVNSAFALPGETMTLSVGRVSGRNEYVVQTTLDALQTGPNTWTWKAPREVGIYPINISHSDESTTAQLNVFVMAPLTLARNGTLNGYRIGQYPTKVRRQLSTYTLPRGLIEVTKENENILVSPHFRLRQFLCKQEGAYPKYIALDPRLLVVLEAILLKINERGHHSPTLSIMSGYRTPYYNRAIGNSTTYSRHLWGDAADIFVDSNPRDGEMDDFNNDGVINIRDTEVLHDIVSEMYAPRARRFLADSFSNKPILQQLVLNSYADDAPQQKLLTGGLARYRPTSSHGPFVHVDVRGIFTRWGR